MRFVCIKSSVPLFCPSTVTDSNIFFAYVCTCSQIQFVMQNKPKEAKNFLTWYEDWLNRANKVTFRLRIQDLDPKESYRRHFKKAIDFYDQSDEYVKTELVFRELFNLRERCRHHVPHLVRNAPNTPLLEILAVIRVAIDAAANVERLLP